MSGKLPDIGNKDLRMNKSCSFLEVSPGMDLFSEIKDIKAGRISFRIPVLILCHGCHKWPNWIHHVDSPPSKVKVLQIQDL